MSDAVYVTLRQEAGVYTIVLLDADQHAVGYGYKGPTQRRAEQDLKYWKRDKGLEEMPA